MKSRRRLILALLVCVAVVISACTSHVPSAPSTESNQPSSEQASTAPATETVSTPDSPVGGFSGSVEHSDVIFMIHGMGRTTSLWDNYVGFFESQGYDTKAITLLYHGNSKDKLKDIGVMDYVEQAKTEIEKLSDKPIIIGCSMGGLIAQQLAEMGLASKLVLIAPSVPKGISVMAPSVLITFSANICDVVLKKTISHTL